MGGDANLYRVTVRYSTEIQQYEVFEIEAADLREALVRAAQRCPDRVLESGDLAEVRLANPAAPPTGGTPPGGARDE